MDAVKPSIMLATLFHDPPWKPWVVIGSLGEEALTSALQAKAREQEKPEDPRAISYTLDLYKEIIRGAGDRVRSHEKQAILVPLAIASRLSTRDNVNRLDGLKKLFIEAAKIIINHKGNGDYRRGHELVRSADTTSSALDRHALYEFLQKEKVHHEVYSRELRYVNPFTLDEVALPRSIDASRIVDFILGYSSLVASALEKLCIDNEDCSMLAVTVSYLLLEPSWYYYTGSTPGEAYIPVADTRIPTQRSSTTQMQHYQHYSS